ncbi:hypothetical protein P3W45_000081 [Vairimorpha bombi]|jgi:hypothetical protein
MFFKSSNYSITDHTVDPFDIVYTAENEIREVGVTDGGDIYFTQENNIYKFGKQKKNKSQDRISHLKVYDDLLISGDILGNIKIFSKNILIRSYSEHSNKINGLELYDNKILISCSDDATVRIFNILEQKSYKTLEWFEDRVRAIKVVEDVLYIGLMNGYVYGIYLKTYEKVYEFDVKEPVNKIECNLGILYVTSLNKIYKIEKYIKQIGSHTKQITGLNIFNNKIHSISLDGYLKIWSLDGQLISKVNFKSPILGFDIKNDILYFGLEIGRLCRLGDVKTQQKVKEIKNKNLKDYEEEIQYKLFEQEISKNSLIEKLMKKYEHKGALKEALDGNNFKDIFSVIYYLHQQDKIKNAVLYLENQYLVKLLDFISENFHIKVLFEVFHEFLSILLLEYSQDFIDDPDLFDRLGYLSDLVDEECLFQEKLIEVYSFLECFD